MKNLSEFMLSIKKLSRRYLLCLSVLLILVSGSRAQLWAMDENSSLFFNTLQKRLIKDGFDEGRINEIYSSPRVNFEIIGVSRFLRHRESTLNYDQFSSKASIQRARRYMKKHKPILENTEKLYGVDKEIITAIILVESQFGTLAGGSSILNVLSTMASLSDPVVRNLFWNKISSSVDVSRKKYEKWAKRKSTWAYAELKALLKYTAKENMDPSAVYGSYAGALGIAQFMPSSILAYAKDGNNDGQIDLFNHADSIMSIASYLKHYGWHAGIEKKRAQKVIYRYNHSKYYVDAILKIAVLLKG